MEMWAWHARETLFTLQVLRITMNLKSLVFRRGSEYMTCWMMDDLIRFNCIAEFYELGSRNELEKNLNNVMSEHPELLERYTLGLRGGTLMNRNDYFCTPGNVGAVVRALGPNIGKMLPNAVDRANQFMIEQLVVKCRAEAAVSTADTIVKLAEKVQYDKILQKRLKRHRPDIAAALELIPVGDEDDEDAPQAVPLAPTKKARPYDLKKKPVVRFEPAPLRCEEEDEVDGRDEECEALCEEEC